MKISNGIAVLKGLKSFSELFSFFDSMSVTEVLII
jgi:hypothetical protein